MRGPERAERVVRVRGGGAEERVDGVADVLLDDSALRTDLRAHALEGVGERPLQALRTKTCRQRGRADDVDEHAGDEAALFARFWHEARVRKRRRPLRLEAAHEPPERRHRYSTGAAAFTGTSGMASSSSTASRRSIVARDLMSSSTFLRPFILPMRIAPTSRSSRKKSRL